MKAVLDTNPISTYDDNAGQHYHLPHRYLATVERCVGDWVVLRRPRADSGNLAYFAIARVVDVEYDLYDPDMSYARFGEYLPFDHPVPWRVNGRYAEAALRQMPQKQVGIYLRGRSVRAISDEDFADIVLHGLSKTLGENDPSLRFAFQRDEARIEVESGAVRQVEIVLANRVIREAGFRRAVCLAYEERCAITGVSVRDRRGNCEAQAAHIWAVADGGPDLIQNGIALSATAHWLFDRHLISLSNDYRLLVSKKIVAEQLLGLLTGGRKMNLPKDTSNWPHPKFLEKHRRLFSKLEGTQR